MILAGLEALVTKISVLANGTVLVDGNPATLDEVDAALANTKLANGEVWYYREAAGNEPPPIANRVMDRVVAYKLPVTLSTKPDFSDWVDSNGVSHARDASATEAEMDEYFAIVRRTAAGRGEGEGLVIVKSDRSLMVLPQMAESPQLKGMAAKVARIVPADKPRNIAVITQTVFQGGPQGQAGLAEVGKAIPFFGILVGLSYIGHAVWLMDGREDVLVPGCREADVLVVDSAVRASLPAGWEAKVAAVMRNANILVHNRATFAFSPIRKVGTNPNVIEFK